MFQTLPAQTKGLINVTSNLKLAMSPGMLVYLSKATDFNVSVADMLKKYFPSLEIVSLPEMTSSAGVEPVTMFTPEIKQLPTGQLGFSEKIRTHALIQKASSYDQKFSATTYGCLIYFPLAFASIMGMESAS